jgi:hypothetical protein
MEQHGNEWRLYFIWYSEGVYNVASQFNENFKVFAFFCFYYFRL